MDDKKENKPNEEEKKIPVFTVLKNNVILKNIFLLDNPPFTSDLKSISSIDKSDQEMEEILTVGRHPDCSIMLTHPSISRFHLRIHSKPSSQELSVVDLSSVHGTWVSEKKIEPGVRVELNEGDVIRMGGSSRVYRVHWVPLSRAYDLENPFVSPSDVLMAEEKEGENVLDEEGKEEETCQDENSLSVENKQTQLNVEAVDSLSFCENSELFVKKVIPSAPPMPENMNYSLSLEEETAALPVAEISEEIKYQSPSKKDHEESDFLSLWSGHLAIESVNSSLPVGVVFSETENQQFDIENRVQQSLVVTEVPSERESPTRKSEEKWNLLEYFSSSFFDDEEGNPASEVLEDTENQSSSREDNKQREISCLSGSPAMESVNLTLPSRIVFSEIENQEFDKENQTPRPLFAATGGPSERENPESPPIRSQLKSNLPSIWSRRGKPVSILQVQTGRSKGKSRKVGIDAEVEPQMKEDTENRSISKALFPGLEGDEDEIFTPNKENFTPNTLLLKAVKRKLKVEEIKHSMSYRSSSSKVSISPSIHPEEDTFAFSDKENQTPKVLQERKSLKPTSANQARLEVEEIKHSMSYRSSSSKVAISPSIQPEEDTFAFSDKENQTPKVLQERKILKPTSANQARLEHEMLKMKRRAERASFQSLLANSTGKSKSEASVLNDTTRSSNSVNCVQSVEKNSNPLCNNSAGEGKKRWYMVVDTSCLVNKEARKSLQLLQGLKGTQLIIPRMVIRELDCLKRRGSLFRRTTEVSSALQWIEECMVNMKSWIHVQSSVEEGRPIAPTPPASPRSRFSEGSEGYPSGTTNSVPFSACGSLMEVVSPTAEDHILDCALLFRRIKHDGQLVLLTNDVTLKIKAMAEGLICETAEEFRESLVNPFSERFLWAESSPRGLTWSCLDDVVLREKYYGCPLKKASKGEGVRGLKLILLHNSQYGQIRTIN